MQISTRYRRYIQNTRRQPGGGGPGPAPRRPGRTGTRASGPGRAAAAWPPLGILYISLYLVYICIYLYGWLKDMPHNIPAGTYFNIFWYIRYFSRLEVRTWSCEPLTRFEPFGNNNNSQGFWVAPYAKFWIPHFYIRQWQRIGCFPFSNVAMCLSGPYRPSDRPFSYYVRPAK